MIKYARHLFLLIILILMLGSVGLSQNSGTSTPQKLQAPTNRAELLSLTEQAIAEVKASRAMILTFETTINNYETALEEAKKLNALSEQELAAKDVQLAEFKASLESMKDAMAKKELQVQEYQKALAKVTKKKNFFKRLAEYSAIIAVVAVVVAVEK